MKKNKVATAIACAALAGSMLLTGCGSAKPDDVVINIDNGKDSYTYGYLNFYAHYTQAMYDQVYTGMYGQNYWSEDLYSSGSTMEEQVKENIISDVEEEYVTKLHAGDYDVTLTDDDQKDIDDAVDKFMSSNSDTAIEQVGATEDYVRQMLEYQSYKYKVKQAFEDQTDVEVTDDESIQSTISYVKFSTQASSDSSSEDSSSASTDTSSDSSSEESTLSDKELKALKESAENVASSDDFDKAAKAEGADVQSYTYTASEDPADDTTLNEDVISAAQKLKDGEVSDVIDVDGDGYYVVRMDKTNDKSATKDKVDELTKSKKDDAYDKQVKKWEKDVTFDVNDKLWKQITFDDLFEYPQTDASGDATSSK